MRLSLLCVGVLAVATSTEAKPVITIFDVPHATQVFQGGTAPIGMNQNGDVTGYYTTKSVRHGFIRTADGQYLTFVVRHRAHTFPLAINDARAVTGVVRTERGVPRGFLRTPDGAVTLLDPPGSGGSSYGTEPLVIDDAGNIGGYYEDVAGVLHGFLRAPDGTYAVYDAPGGGRDPGEGTFVTNMTAKDHLVGYSFDTQAGQFGFTRSASGRRQVQFAYPGATATSPQAMNDGGVITGYYTNADEVWHGLVGTTGGGFASFDAPSGGTLAGAGTTGYAVNKSGLIGGFAIDDNFAYHGFLRKASGEIVPIDIEGAGTDANKGTIVEAVSDAGVVMGYFTDANGVNHGFLRSRD